MQEVAKAIIGPVVAMGLAWLVGNRLSAKWGVWQKRREQAQTTANEFYKCYGEFFSIWKLWNYSVEQAKDSESWEERRWELLKRAAAAESGVEALIVKVAAERSLDDCEKKALGSFRQGFQQLRQAIKRQVQVPWHSSEHREYLAFKKLAAHVARIASTVDSGKPPDVEAAQAALLEITSNQWESVWWGPEGERACRPKNLLQPTRSQQASAELK